MTGSLKADGKWRKKYTNHNSRDYEFNYWRRIENRNPNKICLYTLDLFVLRKAWRCGVCGKDIMYSYTGRNRTYTVDNTLVWTHLANHIKDNQQRA